MAMPASRQRGPDNIGPPPASRPSRNRRRASSSDRKSSRPPSPPRQNAADRVLRHPNLTPHPRLVTGNEEERLLLANRQRLLARKDWLGLSACRPVPYKFPSSHHRERFGKRHRIEKSTERPPQPAYHRPLTPLFKQTPHHLDPVMSGALPDDNMQIRIGTDAFATQTQPSRKSRTPINTSLRHPSAETDTLSEEPMLLGVDEDGFETIEGSHALLQEPPTNAALAPLMACSEGDDTCVLLEDLDGLDGGKIRSSDRGGRESSATYFEVAEPAHLSDDEDEQVWRTLMQVQQATSVNSMAAVASSSHRRTQTTNSTWLPIHKLRSSEQLAAERKRPSQDDELWRRFIVGSRSSGDTSNFTAASHSPRPCLARDEPVSIDDERLNDHPQSDRATAGGTIFAGEAEQPSSYAIQPAFEDIENASLIGQASTVKHDDIDALGNDYRQGSRIIATDNIVRDFSKRISHPKARRPLALIDGSSSCWLSRGDSGP